MAEVTVMRTPAETGLSQQFETAKGALPGDPAAREQAFRLFAERGLPHRRVEDFKYTDLRTLVREAAPPAAKPSADAASAVLARARAFADCGAVRIALVNGHVALGESDLDRLPAGVEVVPLAEALTARHPLLARMSPVAAARDNVLYGLNAAFMTDGALVRVAAGTAVETPLHLRFVNAGAAPFATATRVLVVAEEGASVTLLESHEGPAGVAYQANDALEIVVADHATVRHVRLNAQGRDALALSTLAARLGAHAAFDTINAVVGSAVSRHQIYVEYAGEHAIARINGAAMLNGRQHADTTLNVDHAVPHGVSRELFKTVLDDEATGVFQGKIIVAPHAQKSDGRMMSAAVLLGEGGAMSNKPELEIFADDVVCAHGATCGALDEDLLFYLKARGLPKPEAESLLLQAFLGEALELVEDVAVRDALVALVERWLQARA